VSRAVGEDRRRLAPPTFFSRARPVAAKYARQEMARRTVGPRRSDSPRAHVRSTQIIAGLSVLVLLGAAVWDLTDDEFWFRHTLFTALVASLIVVAVTAAVLNEVLERRRRERWSVLAQYALFDLIRTARLVWTGLLELAGLAPDGELEDEALAAGSEAVLDTPRLAAAILPLHIAKRPTSAGFTPSNGGCPTRRCPYTFGCGVPPVHGGAR